MSRMGLNLERILQAAAEIADSHGLDEVTLALLAKKLNVRSPSLYNHIEGLPWLRQQLACYGIKKLNSILTFAAVGRSQDEAVHAIAKAYVDFVREHPGLYDATVRTPEWSDPETQKVAGETVELLARVFQAYGLEGDDAVHVVRGLRSMVHGFASLEQTGNFNIPIDANVSLRILIDFFLEGIRSAAAKKDRANTEG